MNHNLVSYYLLLEMVFCFPFHDTIPFKFSSISLVVWYSSAHPLNAGVLWSSIHLYTTCALFYKLVLKNFSMIRNLDSIADNFQKYVSLTQTPDICAQLPIKHPPPKVPPSVGTSNWVFQYFITSTLSKSAPSALLQTLSIMIPHLPMHPKPEIVWSA